MASIWLAIPHTGLIHPGVMHAALQSPGHQLHVLDTDSGCLTYNFNTQWCRAYNAHKELALDYFAMIHSDVSTQEGWTRILIDELERTGADILSAVVAIKDTKGLTSTAIGERDSWSVRRLTMKEIYDLPETFSIEDTKHPKNGYLAINTGLWIMRFNAELWRKFHGFQVQNRMFYNPESDRMETTFRPEDWEFGAWADSMGLKVFVTRKALAIHHGKMEFPNNEAWGHWEFDREFTQAPASGSESHLGGATLPTVVTPNGDPASWCPPVWDELISEGVKTVLDVGCGAGFAARYFESKGCDVLGIDADHAALSAYQGQKYLKHDYTKGPAPLYEEFDLVWCCEAVEHVDSKYESFLLDSFARAKTIAMTHAFPGQPGTHHVNLQEPDYWIQRIKGLGYRFDSETSLALRDLVNHGSSEGYHFARSGLIFRKVEA